MLHLPQELLRTAWDAWRMRLTQRGSLLALADMASKSRRLRIMSEVFTIWQQYVAVRQAGCVPCCFPCISPGQRTCI